MLNRILTGIWVTMLWSTQAVAEPRIALVVGNAGYVAVSALENPLNDANLIAHTLREIGFEVTLVLDGDKAALEAAVSQFGNDLRAAGTEATGLFYFAGHGLQSFGRNYLLPVDAAPLDAADLGLVALEAEQVLRQMSSARNRTNIVILDACRNNPFSAILDLDDNGLAEMNAPTGTFLAYATAPGSLALDGLGGNSPFTAAIAAQIMTPGLPIEQAFRQVRVAVLEETQGLQTPWDASSLVAPFSFVPAEVIAPEELAERQMWDSVNVSRDPVEIMLFLRAYPESARASEARQLMIDVMAEAEGETVAVTPEADVASNAEVTEPEVVAEDAATLPEDAESDAARDASVATAAVEPAPPSDAALQTCPVSLGTGLRLIYADGVIETFRPHPDREAVVTVRGVQDGQTIYELELLKGAHVISNDKFVDGDMDPENSIAYDFDRPLTEIPLPLAGQSWTVTAQVTDSGGTFSEVQNQTYNDLEDVRIGPCTYGAVEVEITYDENGTYSEGLHYLPALGISYLDWSQDGDAPPDQTEPILIETLR